MNPQEFIAKWRASELNERSAAQEHFIDLCRLLGRTHARRGRSERTALLLRARRAQGHRRPRLGRRLETPLLRLGVQGQAQRPRRRLQPAAPVRARAGKPAPADRLGYGPLPHPHQLDQQRQRRPRVRVGRVGRRVRARQAEVGHVRSRTAASRREPPGPDRTRRHLFRRPRPSPPHARPRPPGGRPLRQPPRLLHVRRGCRPAAQRHVYPHVGTCPAPAR